MGYEGFSKSLPLDRMNPVTGNKGEFLFLFFLIALVPIVGYGRKSNEEGLRSIVKSTNRYAELKLSEDSKKPSKWTL
jgi:hypothetical protein